ncbi:hypothetical protein E2C01_019823 [Portunus trituberculatus]|uniref:Uncharacterized protein n=1 Tax=Portunus trituberculatus TaxID=210409 RepID=A0A5B7E0G6_PORTR|nr:hypothetical protein [Portunus trituberculatus]
MKRKDSLRLRRSCRNLLVVVVLVRWWICCVRVCWLVVAVPWGMSCEAATDSSASGCGMISTYYLPISCCISEERTITTLHQNRTLMPKFLSDSASPPPSSCILQHPSFLHHGRAHRYKSALHTHQWELSWHYQQSIPLPAALLSSATEVILGFVPAAKHHDQALAGTTGNPLLNVSTEGSTSRSWSNHHNWWYDLRLEGREGQCSRLDPDWDRGSNFLPS